jgi:hypothetical protein
MSADPTEQFGEAPAFLMTEGELVLDREASSYPYAECCQCGAGLGPDGDDGDLCNSCDGFEYEDVGHGASHEEFEP